MKNKSTLLTLLLLFVVLSACVSASDSSDLPKVVVSTSIIADVAEQISDGAFDIKVLLPAGVDPHGYQPTPKDIAVITDADLVLINGYGLEEFLNSILNENDLGEKLVVVSEGVEIKKDDPHVWLDPHNVMIWSENITDAFTDLSPDKEDEFRQNSQDYTDQLIDLNAWIIEAVSQVPEENRVLISDHMSLGYFADRYGFEQAATITQSASSLAEPSAQELAELIDLIDDLGLPALFIGHEVNPELAESLAGDLGIDLVKLYIGALSLNDEPANTYLKLMYFNVEAITLALK